MKRRQFVFVKKYSLFKINMENCTEVLCLKIKHLHDFSAHL